MPPSVPLNHYLGPENQQNRTRGPIPLFHARTFERNARFEHSDLFKVNLPTTLKAFGVQCRVTVAAEKRHRALNTQIQLRAI